MRQSDPETAAALEKLEKAHTALFDSDAGSSGIWASPKPLFRAAGCQRASIATCVGSDTRFSALFPFPFDTTGHESATEANSRLMDIMVHERRRGSSMSSDQMSSDSAGTSASGKALSAILDSSGGAHHPQQALFDKGLCTVTPVGFRLPRTYTLRCSVDCLRCLRISSHFEALLWRLGCPWPVEAILHDLATLVRLI